MAHAFAPLPEALTQETISALENKAVALFLRIGGAWVDNHGEAHYWAECKRADFSQGPPTWNSFQWTNL
jgi:hypothetical protein